MGTQDSGRQSCECLDVLLGGSADYVVGEDGARRSLVPIQHFEVIADELFVEARLRLARYVRVGGPEARAVRRERFVDEEQLVTIETKFEFRVGDDDAALGGVIAGEAVEREGNVPDLFGERLANNLGAAVKIDVLIVARLGLRGGCKYRVGKGTRFDQAFRQAMAADAASLLVF